MQNQVEEPFANLYETHRSYWRNRAWLPTHPKVLWRNPCSCRGPSYHPAFEGDSFQLSRPCSLGPRPPSHSTSSSTSSLLYTPTSRSSDRHSLYTMPRSQSHSSFNLPSSTSELSQPHAAVTSTLTVPSVSSLPPKPPLPPWLVLTALDPLSFFPTVLQPVMSVSSTQTDPVSRHQNPRRSTKSQKSDKVLRLM